MVHNPCHMNWNKPPLFNWVIEQWYIYIYILYIQVNTDLLKKNIVMNYMQAVQHVFFLDRLDSFENVWASCRVEFSQVAGAPPCLLLAGGKHLVTSGMMMYLVVYVYICTSHINSHLVGDWNIWIIFPYIGNNDPNWLIFFRGVGQPATSVYLHTSSHINSHILNMSKLCWSAFYRRSPVEFFGCTPPSPIQFTKETAW